MLKWGLKLLAKMIFALFLIIVLLIGFVDLFAGLILKKGYYLNWTSSMPIGFYKMTAPAKLQPGEDVMVCLPPAVGKVGLHHEYLMFGNCPGGFEPIIKELIAVPGDTVILTNEAMIVGSNTYPAYTRAKDHLDRPLAAIARGTYANIQSYWLYGKNRTKDSWDSRYWGGVDRSNIISIATPVATLP